MPPKTNSIGRGKEEGVDRIPEAGVLMERSADGEFGWSASVKGFVYGSNCTENWRHRQEDLKCLG